MKEVQLPVGWQLLERWLSLGYGLFLRLEQGCQRILPSSAMDIASVRRPILLSNSRAKYLDHAAEWFSCPGKH